MIRSSAYLLFQRILRTDKLPSACTDQRLFGCARVNIPSPFFNPDGDGGGQACCGSYCPIAVDRNSPAPMGISPWRRYCSSCCCRCRGGCIGRSYPRIHVWWDGGFAVVRSRRWHSFPSLIFLLILPPLSQRILRGCGCYSYSPTLRTHILLLVWGGGVVLHAVGG